MSFPQAKSKEKREKKERDLRANLKNFISKSDETNSKILKSEIY